MFAEIGADRVARVKSRALTIFIHFFHSDLRNPSLFNFQLN